MKAVSCRFWRILTKSKNPFRSVLIKTQVVFNIMDLVRTTACSGDICICRLNKHTHFAPESTYRINIQIWMLAPSICKGVFQAQQKAHVGEIWRMLATILPDFSHSSILAGIMPTFSMVDQLFDTICSAFRSSYQLFSGWAKTPEAAPDGLLKF